MFLSKKKATNTSNKNKSKANVQKPLGGWGDDDNDDGNDFSLTHVKQDKKVEKEQLQTMNLLDEPADSTVSSYQKVEAKVEYRKEKASEKKIYFDWDELNLMNEM